MSNRFSEMKELREELQELLEEFPHLADLQEQIDERMAHAGNQYNRLAIINQMMLDQFNRLADEMNDFLATDVSDSADRKRTLQ